ncbi:MAG: hypothetical protein ACUVS2_18010 [Candidatus Flexifilum sp.]
MAKVTFGSYLRELMNQRNWTSELVSDQIYGDQGNNRNAINRWLQIDRTDHTRQKGNYIGEHNIDKLADAFKLSYIDRFYLYGLAGKIPLLPLPSFEEVTQILEPLIPSLETWPYPAYIVDKLHFRFWAVNAATLAVIGGYEKARELANCTVFQLLFAKKYGVTDLFGDKLEAVRREQIRYYKTLNIWVRHESFYMEYPERLRDRDGLTPEEYAVFECLWNETFPFSVQSDASRSHVQISQSGLPFDLVPNPILALNNLFYIIWYHLRSDDAELKAQLSQRFGLPVQSTDNRKAVKLWELSDVDLKPIWTDQWKPVEKPIIRIRPRPRRRSGSSRRDLRGHRAP